MRALHRLLGGCDYKSTVLVLQLSNMTLRDYMEEHIYKPANLSNAFYWTGEQGMQPEGLREHVLPMPGYYATYEGNHLRFFMHFYVALIHLFIHNTPFNPQIRCAAADILWQPSSLPCLGISSTM